MNEKPRFSLIIPVYNEEKGIKDTLTALNPFLNEKLFEVIIVDDGSSDNTPQFYQLLKKFV